MSSLSSHRKIYAILLCIVALVTHKILYSSASTKYVCDLHPYTPRVISLDPLIIHLENFVTPYEREYLLSLPDLNFWNSTTLAFSSEEETSEYRTSTSAYLPPPKKDDVVKCIYERTSQLQGYHRIANIEALQMVRYQTGQQYKAHMDWEGKGVSERRLKNGKIQMGDRLFTIFALLTADCTNCGTQFPQLIMNWTNEDERWCEFVDCNQEQLTLTAKAGNAVFWRNLDAHGNGDIRTEHAGLPVHGDIARKVGLNIWSREII